MSLSLLATILISFIGHSSKFFEQILLSGSASGLHILNPFGQLPFKSIGLCMSKKLLPPGRPQILKPPMSDKSEGSRADMVLHPFDLFLDEQDPLSTS